MSKPTLVILAAGMASRYGSQKQTEGFGPSNETIMEYSIYDAIQAGFGKVVFIIRKDFAENFEALYNNKLAGKIEVAYVYQYLTAYTGDVVINAERTKPWGTGQALLCATPAITQPFAIINADDFYGKDAFVQAANFLTIKCTEANYAIVGYTLRNTLSENGTVSRGVCEINKDGNLISVTERVKIFANETGMVYDDNDAQYPIEKDARASMNFWLFHPSVLPVTQALFNNFLQLNANELKAEFFLTNIGDYAIKSGKATMAVLPTDASWFGVTYKEDAPIVKGNIMALVKAGNYPNSLWA